MNLLIFEPSECTPDGTAATLTDPRRIEHLKEVLGAKPQDRFRCGVWDGKCGYGTVRELTKTAAVFDLALTDAPPPKLPLTLILALPRPQSLKKSLAAAITLGVREIHLIHSARTEKSYWQTPVLSETGLKRELLLALEQARDPVPPIIHMHPRFKTFAEDVMPTLMRGKQGFIAHPEDASICPCNVDGELVLAIGAEGGWVPYEIDAFRDLGFQCITLGERILRVEQAIPTFFGRLLHP